MDSERDDPYGADDSLTGELADAPDDAAVDAEPVAEPVAARQESRLVLGTLAGAGAVLLGIVVWSLLYAYTKRDYVGVSVVFGLLVGYVVREVSRRSDLVPRIVAAVLTAILCVFGSVIALVANTVRVYPGEKFFDVLGNTLPNTFEIVSKRNALTYVIFVAAVVVAFLSAGPSKPKAPAAAPVADEGDEPQST